MGAGRKTSTYEYDHKSAQMYNAQNFEARQRNLGEQLGGCIFGCTNDTMSECITDLVFGLPRAHWCYVQWISKDSPLFLFNYTTRKLHGIFRAESDGEWEIKPDGWCKGSGTKTQYPSQVRVSNYCECEPLSDWEYKPLMKECIQEEGRLLFELKRHEAQALCRAFDEKTNGRKPVGQQRAMPSATGADTAMARQKKEPFRAASPPATPAWGSRTEAPAEPPVPQKPPQKAVDLTQESDYPSLSAKATALAAAKKAQEASTAASSGSSQQADTSYGKAVQHNKLQRQAEAGPSTASKLGTVAEIESRPVNTITPTPRAAPQSPPQAAPVELPRDVAGPSRQAVNGSVVSTAPSDAMQVDEAVPVHQELTAEAKENAFSVNYRTLLDNVHTSMMGVDKTTADHTWHLFRLVKDQLDQGMRDRYALAQVADRLVKSNVKLTNLAQHQSMAIEVLKEEATALRRDLAFVGGQMNISVTPVNTYVEALEPLPILSEQPTTSTYPEPENHLGVGLVNESLIIFGGNNSSVWVDTIDVFTPALNSWTSKHSMPKPAGYWSAASLPNHVYLVGGGNGKIWTNSCLRYDYATNEWFEMASMADERGSLGAVALDGKIYAIGGGKPKVQLDAVEVLDPNVNQWMRVKSMISARFATAATVVDEAIYVTGGFNGADYLATSERYDPREGRWQALPDCSTVRGGHEMVTVGSDVYALGGWDNTDFLEVVDIFDTRAGAWRQGKDMKTKHAYFSAAHLDGDLYAMSGMSDRKVFNTLTERHDATKDTWSAFYIEPNDAEHGRKRSFAASCKFEG